ncbi:MAG: hypothetical protein U0796_03765 [Gemmatales bacterium]
MRSVQSFRIWSCLTLVIIACSARNALAQEPASFLEAVVQAKTEKPQQEILIQASCDSCGGGTLYNKGGSFSSSGCGSCGLSDCGGCGAPCFPGQTCTSCVGSNAFENFFCRMHNAVCCPDPCYEPTWIAAANAAFFQDSARPVNMTRIRWDHGNNLLTPDRNNYFFAPTNNLARLRGISYDELRMSTEVGTEKFSVTMDTPYRYWTGDGDSKAGFTDIAIATKSLLLDSDFFQMSFQMRTGIPTADSTAGLGLRLVTLEPSLLFTMRLWNDTFFQAQIAEWVPLGVSDTAGSLLRYNFAVNQLLWKSPTCCDMQLVGTFEVNCMSFQAGRYSDIQNIMGVDTVVQRDSFGGTYVSVGPGVRYQLCEKLDIGFSASFNVSEQHYAEQVYRTEFRWRF